MVAHTCNPSAKEEETKGPLDSQVSQPSLLSKLQASERPRLKEQEEHPE